MIRRSRHRVAALESRLGAPIPGLDVVPEWRALARRNPEARAHAEAYTARARRLWGDREPEPEEILDDPECSHHWLWLSATDHGGLGNFLALAWRT